MQHYSKKIPFPKKPKLPQGLKAERLQFKTIICLVCAQSKNAKKRTEQKM